ncbi:C-type mannose receptor 2-like [Leguminivora glycinivorella]|uniref:C-type mannose receptor 2-like n=1 Tax=Leguminivora glycinivorella TaxID=1035111 RepID=UPI00201020B9|nr:C-type mannose receptor 2-like [Leguminivora glycinivorella]
MYRFILLCGILLTGSQYSAGNPLSSTAYEYVQEADAWLRLHIVPATWSDAVARCQLEDGVLAAPTTKAVAKAMLSAMEKHKLTSKGVFIGATSLFSKGEFRTLNGENLADSLEWASGEPDNTGDAEDCLMLTGKGALADVSCSRVLPYFCRKNVHNCSSVEGVTSAKPLLLCGLGYHWYTSTGSCYKFHGASKPWRLALATCHSDGGHLVVIDSETESDVLKEIYEDNFDTITGADQPRHALIGFRKYDDGEWATIFGETLAEAGFAKWDSEEPSNGNGVVNEYCGSMHINGLLNDASCSWKSPFICEITPTLLL